MVHSNLCGSQLIWCLIFIKKLIFAQEVRKFLLFWNPKCSYQCSRKAYWTHSPCLPSNLLPHVSILLPFYPLYLVFSFTFIESMLSVSLSRQSLLLDYLINLPSPI